MRRLLGKLRGGLVGGRVTGGLMVLLLAVFALAFAPAGCSDGEKCVGGVEIDGVCMAKCDSSKCANNNVCVDNACRLLCEEHIACLPGVQECAERTSDDGLSVQVCVSNGRQPVLPDGFYPIGGYGQNCPFGQDQCTQLACPNGLECDLNAPPDCVLDTEACAGFDNCNIGRTATGARCTFNTCDPSQCQPFACISVNGDGDANAYCAAFDCENDDQCPGGFYCGHAIQPEPVCGVTCPGPNCVPTDASEKGGNPICSAESLACVDIGAANAAGLDYIEGPRCLMRKICRKRDACVRCEHNLDCVTGDGDVCHDYAGAPGCQKFCTPDEGADTSGDCTVDQACVPYVPATGGAGSTCLAASNVQCDSPADCPPVKNKCVDGQCLLSGEACILTNDCTPPSPPLEDQCVPRFVCVPRGGSCNGPPPGAPSPFCHNCVDDLDCGGPESNYACIPVGQTGRACINQFAQDCNTDADCEVSPSGLQGYCLDEAVGVDPGTAIYHKCYAPFDPNQGFKCW